ncbi:MAG: HNH endonuclease [Candidatus Micrarchaeota archaeon]|nr:HNH endonuclease [Candidatus Micrarchaeota archaeon]
MPPSAVKSIRDLIFWQYAKLISKSAGFGINARAFQMSTFKKLQSGEMVWSTTIREYLREQEKPGVCIYCGAKTGLTVEHILPRCRGGPDSPDNAVMVCKSCNSRKGGKRLYECFGLEEKDKIPRIAEGKYLKLLYSLHEKNRTLDLPASALASELCPKCDLGPKCPEKAKLSVYCLEGCFLKNPGG